MFLFLCTIFFCVFIKSMDNSRELYQIKLTKRLEEAPVVQKIDHPEIHMTEFCDTRYSKNIFKCDKCNHMQRGRSQALMHSKECSRIRTKKTYYTQETLKCLFKSTALITNEHPYYDTYETSEGFRIYQCKHKDWLLRNSRDFIKHYRAKHGVLISLAAHAQSKTQDANSIDGLQELPNIIVTE